MTMRRRASTCSRQCSLNLLVQTQHSEHKNTNEHKKPLATAAARRLFHDPAIISLRGHAVFLSRSRIAFPALHFSAKRRAASLPRNFERSRFCRAITSRLLGSDSSFYSVKRVARTVIRFRCRRRSEVAAFPITVNFAANANGSICT